MIHAMWGLKMHSTLSRRYSALVEMYKRWNRGYRLISLGLCALLIYCIVVFSVVLAPSFLEGLTRWIARILGIAVAAGIITALFFGLPILALVFWAIGNYITERYPPLLPEDMTFIEVYEALEAIDRCIAAAEIIPLFKNRAVSSLKRAVKTITNDWETGNLKMTEEIHKQVVLLAENIRTRIIPALEQTTQYDPSKMTRIRSCIEQIASFLSTTPTLPTLITINSSIEHSLGRFERPPLTSRIMKTIRKHVGRVLIVIFILTAAVIIMVGVTIGHVNIYNAIVTGISLAISITILLDRVLRK